MLETGKMTRLRGTLARKGRNGLASQGLHYYRASIRPYAKQMNLVKEIRPLLNELITKDIRIGNNLLKKVLESVNENE
jgi:hypothetical protein